MRGVGDRLGRNVIAIDEKRPGGLGHHDQPIANVHHLRHNLSLPGGGVAENRVKRRNDWHPELADQLEDVVAVDSAEDAVLVLYAHEVDLIRVQPLRGEPVVVEPILLDVERDILGVVVSFRPVGHCHDPDLDVLGGAFQALDQVVRKRGDAALTRDVGSNHCYGSKSSTRVRTPTSGRVELFRVKHHKPFSASRLKGSAGGAHQPQSAQRHV